MRKNENIDLQIISTCLFIIATFISLSITYDEKLKSEDKNGFYTKDDALNISFNNRLLFLVAVLISFYVAINNYLKTETNREKYKSGILLISSILTIITSLLVLYVSYLNKKENTLNSSDIQNTLI
ncbi:MAG: hypothetical protein IIZ40_00960 [Bacilli bacterium]|nr:hypothetical protein [Bacilli bacterium]